MRFIIHGNPKEYVVHEWETVVRHLLHDEIQRDH